MGSALAGSGYVLDLADFGSVRHSQSFWQVLIEATPVTPPLPKPCHATSVH